MKQVIDGLTYNTETADLIGQWDNGLPLNDFNNCDEDLYRTKKGRFFLRYRGGGLSRWAVSVGNGRTGSEGIQALSTEEALSWCESHGIDADTIAQYFEVEDA